MFNLNSMILYKKNDSIILKLFILFLELYIVGLYNYSKDIAYTFKNIYCIGY